MVTTPALFPVTKLTLVTLVEFPKFIEPAALAIRTLVNVCTPANVFAASVRAAVNDVVGVVIVMPSVELTVIVLLTVNVFPSAMVSVAPVAGAVRANLLIVVAVATPRDGVVSDGDVDNTMLPVPVTALESVTPPYVSAPESVVGKGNVSVVLVASKACTPCAIRSTVCSKPPMPVVRSPRIGIKSGTVAVGATLWTS